MRPCAATQPPGSIAALMRRKSIRSFDTPRCARAISPVSSYEAAALTGQRQRLCHLQPCQGLAALPLLMMTALAFLLLESSRMWDLLCGWP